MLGVSSKLTPFVPVFLGISSAKRRRSCTDGMRVNALLASFPTISAVISTVTASSLRYSRSLRVSDRSWDSSCVLRRWRNIRLSTYERNKTCVKSSLQSLFRQPSSYLVSPAPHSPAAKSPAVHGQKAARSMQPQHKAAIGTALAQ
jgi:hypothetical protein